jgi:hypothetical protein
VGRSKGQVTHAIEGLGGPIDGPFGDDVVSAQAQHERLQGLHYALVLKPTMILQRFLERAENGVV